MTPNNPVESSQQVVYAYPPAQIHDDEIDLFELCANTLKEWKLIGLIGTVFTVLALGFVLNQDKMYAAEAVIVEPRATTIQDLYLTSDYKDDAGSLFSDFFTVLQSDGNKDAFFRESGILVSEAKRLEIDFSIDGKEQELLNDLKESLVIDFEGQALKKGEKPSLSDGVKLFKTGTQRQQNFSVLEQYLQDTNKLFVKNLSEDTKAVHELALIKIESELKRLRDSAELERKVSITKIEATMKVNLADVEDEVSAVILKAKAARQQRKAELQEAYAIADSLGIKKPSNKRDLKDDPGSQLQITMQNSQELYLQGTIYLDAQIKLLAGRNGAGNFAPELPSLKRDQYKLTMNRQLDDLKNRTSNDPYIAGLVSKQVEMERLKEHTFDFSTVQAYHLQTPPQKAEVKSKRMLIVALSVVLGGMFGVFAALIRVAVRNRKAK